LFSFSLTFSFVNPQATLAENKIFIVGGWLGAGPLAASDLYLLDLNPLTPQWVLPRTRGEAPGACNMHTTDFVPSLRSLFVFRGGDGRNYLNDLHLLDIDTFEWSQPKVSGTLPAKRANHSSALLDDCIFIFGGWDGAQRLNDVHVLDTRNMSWSSPKVSGYPPFPRAGMTFTKVGDMIYLFGGSGPQASCFRDLQVFDPNEMKWLAIESKEQVEDDSGLNTDAAKAGYPNIHKPLKASDGTMQTGAALSQGNPNANAQVADLIVTGQGPSERAGHTATLVGRKLVIYGGSCVDEYLGDMFVLDTDQPPKVQVSESCSSLDRMRSRLWFYLDSPMFSDVVFRVEGRRIHGHKMILALASERFQCMFDVRGDGTFFREAIEHEIEIPNVSYRVFRKTLEYLYTGELDISEFDEFGKKNGNRELRTRAVAEGEDAEPIVMGLQPKVPGTELDYDLINFLQELLSFADQFVLDHLKQICEKMLREFVCGETVLDLKQTAEYCNAVQLSAVCSHYLRHFEPSQTKK